MKEIYGNYGVQTIGEMKYFSEDGGTAWTRFDVDPPKAAFAEQQLAALQAQAAPEPGGDAAGNDNGAVENYTEEDV